MAALSGTQAATMTGARAKIWIRDKLIGLATECSWNVRYGQEPVHTLGKHEPQEIVTTSQEAIEVTVNGLRVVNAGPHLGATNGTGASIVPTLQELMGNLDMTIQIEDRQNPGKMIMTVYQCRSLGYSSTVNAKGMMNLSMNFVGIRGTDEHANGVDLKDSSAVTYGIA